MREIILDCSTISCAKQLHKALKEALQFPEWYGHNLDALMDCLTELEEDTHLVLIGWDQSAEYSSRFESVFTHAATENEGFTYTIA
jgi:ribonuclease inhibitor